MVDDNRISIWFFIGSLLTLYGIIIFIVTVPELVPGSPQPHVELANLHAGVWWGGLLFLLGLMYVIVFWPGRKKEDKSSEEE